MAILPRYQRTGVKTRQPQQIDFAAAREQANLGQNISQQINRMSDFAFKQQSAEAELRGQKRVQQEGALPTLESIEAGGGPSTIAERSAYALGSRVAVAEIQNTAEIEIMRILSEAETNETPFSVVQNSLLEATDGYSESLRVIDPAAASVLKVNLQGASAKATERYSNYYVKLQASKQAVKVSNALELQSGNIINDAILPGKTLKTINEDIDAASKLLVDIGATDSEIDLFREQTLNEAVRENTIYKFNTTDLNGQLEMITLMETIPVEGMDLEQTQKFRSFLKARYNEGLSVVRAQATALENSIREQNQILSLGGTPSEKELVNLRLQSVTLGDYGADARSAILDLQDNVATAKTYRAMSPAELALEVESLRDGMPGMEGPGMDTLREVNTFKVANAYLNAANKRIKDASDAEKAEFQPDIDKLSSDIATFQDLLASGFEVTPNDLQALFDDIAAIPLGLRAELAEEYRDLMGTTGVAATMEDMTPSQAVDYISSLESQGVDSKRELANFKFAEKFLTNMEASIKDDPLAYAMTVEMKDASGNVIDITPIDFSDPENTASSIKKRISDATVVASRYNIQPKYFTEEEKNTYSQYLLNADRAQQMFLLGSLVDGGGIAAPDMLAEISKTSPEFAAAGALVSAGSMDAANSLLSGLEYLKSGNKPIEFTPTNTNLIFQQETSLALRYLPNSTQIVRKAAEAIYADKARFKESFDEDIWRESINAAIGGVDDAGGIQEVRGVKTLVPSGLTSDTVEAALKNMTVQSMYAATSGQVVDSNLIEAASGRGWFTNDKNYKIVSRGGSEFAIMLGDPKDGNPIHLNDLSGNPVIFDLLELIEANKITPAPIGGQTPEDMGFVPDEEVVRPEGSVSPSDLALGVKAADDAILTYEDDFLNPSVADEVDPVVSPEALSASRDESAAMAKAKELALEATREVTRQHPKYSEFAEALKSPRYKKILENPDKEKEAFYLWLENMGFD